MTQFADENETRQLREQMKKKRIVNQWVVRYGEHLVQTGDGQYYLGCETNVYHLGKISVEKAEALLEVTP